jgi:PKD repeat protein
MPARVRTAVRRSLAGLLGVLLLTGGLQFVAQRPAEAAVDPAQPATVSADPLPTVQINGVAWSQVVVGTTVYVAGSFSRARPAGAAVGTQETVRNNLLAYDIRTGELITSFAPDLNGQAMSVAASPDGSRIYVGGDFTSANGQFRNRVAAYSTATGALVAGFAPSVNGQVRALAATNSTVYLGGSFSAVGTTSRTKLAAVSAAAGALQPWAPVPGYGSTAGNTLPLFDGNGQPIAGTRSPSNNQVSNEVLAMALTGGGTQLVVSGRFDSLNGVKSTGVGALDAATGATRPFIMNHLITNQGVNSAVWSLSSDGTNVYGTGYDFFGPGNLEGTFVAQADGGVPVWIADCRGDTYSAFATNGVVYNASHQHDCANIGSFPEQSPRLHYYANAYTLAATGLNQSVSPQRANTRMSGWVAPRQLAWSPTFYGGKYTGQEQAGWSVTGNSEYVVYGGEFPAVNSTNQQGLVRFAIRSLAPNKVAPRATSTFAPTVRGLPGGVRVSWPTAVDRDDNFLTYRVYRDVVGGTPVCEVTRPSLWWNAPVAGCEDYTASAGAHQYLVVASDPSGNTLNSSWTATSVTAANAGGSRAYAAAVIADGAANHWSLGETSGGTVFDDAAATDLVAGSGSSRGQTGAIAGDPDRASSFNGSLAAAATSSVMLPAPQTFTLEAWFQTTSTTGGRIVGFGNMTSGLSTAYDRHIYMNPAGNLNFGVYSGANRYMTTPARYNDGRWHHVVGSLGPDGIAIYMDGALIQAYAPTNMALPYWGYWRIGADNTWAGSQGFNGRIDEVAAYPVVLSADQVAAHYRLGTTGTAPNAAPTAAFTSSVAGRTVAFDAGTSADADGSVASYAWNFGDGGTATGRTPSRTYAADGTYTVRLVVTDDDGATATTTRTVTVATDALAVDTFQRTVNGGLGTADIGGAWQASAGATRLSVIPGTATLRLDGAGQNTGAYLAGVSSTQSDVRTSFTLTAAPTGNGTYVYVIGRRVAAGQEYRARARVMADGRVALAFSRLSGGVESFPGGEVVVPGVTWTAGTTLNVRVQVVGTGTTQVTATVWAEGMPEPATPSLTRTDTTGALQAAGGVGLAAHRPGGTTASVDVRVTSFRVAAAD